MSNGEVTFVNVEANEAGREATIRVENRWPSVSRTALRFDELPVDLQAALLAWIETPDAQ